MTHIFGHRGSAGTHPENTMISFQAAKDAGAEGIELDIQMTRDGELVVIHDETVDRTTDGTGYVKDLAFAEITRMDASYLFPQYKGKAYIPSLKEVLEWVRQQGQLTVNIELKNGIIDYLHLEKKTIELVYKYNLQNHVIISSFNHNSLVKCKEIDSNIETAILYMEPLYRPWDYAAKVGASGLHPHIHASNEEVYAFANRHGLRVRPFTINDQHDMKKLMKEKCAGFFTDYPELAVKLRSTL